MPRAKRGFKARRRRNAVLKQARGFRGGRSKLFRQATERVNRAMRFAYRDRRVKKREFRALWITRITAAVRAFGLSYSKFIHALKELNMDLNRKMLSELAVQKPQAFEDLIQKAKTKLAA